MELHVHLNRIDSNTEQRNSLLIDEKVTPKEEPVKSPSSSKALLRKALKENALRERTVHQGFSQAPSKDIYEEAYEYKNNPWKWPALHYAIAQGRFDIAQIALSSFPGELLSQATLPENEIEKFASIALKGKPLYAWELAALYGQEELAIELLKKKGGASINFDTLVDIAIEKKQFNLLTYLCEDAGFKQQNFLKCCSKTDDPEIARIFVFHQLKKIGNKEIQTIDDVPPSFVEAILKYPAKDIHPLRAAMNADDLDSFLALEQMGVEKMAIETVDIIIWDKKITQENVDIYDALFEMALKKDDPRYVFALCNSYNAEIKLANAIRANHKEAVKEIVPYCSRESIIHPVFLAYELSNIEMVYLLLELNIGRDDPYVLRYAIRDHQDELWNYLLNTGYCPSWKHHDICLAAIQANHAQALARVLDLGYTPPVNSYIKAIESSAWPVLEVLIKKGVQPTFFDLKALVLNGRAKEIEQILIRFPFSKEDLSYWAEFAANNKKPEIFALFAREVPKQ